MRIILIGKANISNTYKNGGKGWERALKGTDIWEKPPPHPPLFFFLHGGWGVWTFLVYYLFRDKKKIIVFTKTFFTRFFLFFLFSIITRFLFVCFLSEL